MRLGLCFQPLPGDLRSLRGCLVDLCGRTEARALNDDTCQPFVEADEWSLS